MPKVVITPRSYGLYSPDIWKQWERAGFVVESAAGPLQEEELIRLLHGADALLVGTDQVSRKVLEQSDSLRMICKYGVGIDNIDKEAASALGIVVDNTPGVNTEAVADYTFGLLLSLARQIPESHADLLQGKWKKRVGIEVWGKTLGILGLGAIGKAVARRAKGFDMRIAAFDLYPDYEFAAEYGIKITDFSTLIQTADIVTIHLALTDDTYHLIGSQELAAMKPEALVINTSRGGIVDESALSDALASGRIAGAALDVFQNEPLLDSPLTTVDRLLLTPHNASASIEAIRRMTEQSTERILRFFEADQAHRQEA